MLSWLRDNNLPIRKRRRRIAARTLCSVHQGHAVTAITCTSLRLTRCVVACTVGIRLYGTGGIRMRPLCRVRPLCRTGGIRTRPCIARQRMAR